MITWMTDAFGKGGCLFWNLHWDWNPSWVLWETHWIRVTGTIEVLSCSWISGQSIIIQRLKLEVAEMNLSRAIFLQQVLFKQGRAKGWKSRYHIKKKRRFCQYAWSFSRLSNRENINTDYTIQTVWRIVRVCKKEMPWMAFCVFWNSSHQTRHKY
jgi:hypothetical protein